MWPIAGDWRLKAESPGEAGCAWGSLQQQAEANKLYQDCGIPPTQDGCTHSWGPWSLCPAVSKGQGLGHRQSTRACWYGTCQNDMSWGFVGLTGAIASRGSFYLVPIGPCDWSQPWATWCPGSIWQWPGRFRFSTELCLCLIRVLSVIAFGSKGALFLKTILGSDCSTPSSCLLYLCKLKVTA